MGFFTSKSENLLQSFVDTLFKGVVNSLVIAGVALVVADQVKDSIEHARQRAALRAFNNDYLVTSANFLITSYSNLPCARDSLLVATLECKSEIGKYVAGIEERKNFLMNLFPRSDFVSLGQVVSALNDLKKLPHESGSDSEAINNLIKQLATRIPVAVNQITQNIE